MQKLFTDIIEEAGSMYGIRFDSDTIDAKFFESKDGGGELFLRTCTSENNSNTYLFKTDSSESLLMLCKDLNCRTECYESSLYYHGGYYYLVMHFPCSGPLLLPHLGEYGDVKKAEDMDIWFLSEHAKVIIENNAAERFSRHFDSIDSINSKNQGLFPDSNI